MRPMPVILLGLSLVVLGHAPRMIERAMAQPHAEGTPDEGTPPCAPYDKIMKGLKDDFDEVPVWIGQRKDGTRIVATQSPKGTWTVMLVDPFKGEHGTACMVLDDGGDGPSQGDGT